MKYLTISLLLAALLISAIPALAQSTDGCLTEWQALVDAQSTALAAGTTAEDIRNLNLGTDDPVLQAKAAYDACVAASDNDDAETAASGDTFEVSSLVNWSNPDRDFALSTTYNVPLPAAGCEGYLLEGESPNFNQGHVLLVVCADNITGPYVAGGNNSFLVTVEVEGDEFETSYVLEDGFAWFDIDKDVDVAENLALTIDEVESNLPVEVVAP